MRANGSRFRPAKQRLSQSLRDVSLPSKGSASVCGPHPSRCCCAPPRAPIFCLEMRIGRTASGFYRAKRICPRLRGSDQLFRMIEGKSFRAKSPAKTQGAPNLQNIQRCGFKGGCYSGQSAAIVFKSGSVYKLNLPRRSAATVRPHHFASRRKNV
jgi:hypothetical protein